MADDPTTTAALPWSCCPHCGCRDGQRVGHDDLCAKGCNEAEEMAYLGASDGT